MPATDNHSNSNSSNNGNQKVDKPIGDHSLTTLSSSLLFLALSLSFAL